MLSWGLSSSLTRPHSSEWIFHRSYIYKGTSACPTSASAKQTRSIDKPSDTLFTMRLITFISTLATSVAATFAQTSSSQPAAFADKAQFQQSTLTWTNAYRAMHKVPYLKWNQTLVNYAQAWTDKCQFAHSDPTPQGKYGENLATNTQTPAMAVQYWAGEAKYYNYTAGVFSSQTGHFTQLVWKASTSLGCSRTYCGGNRPDGTGRAYGWFMACEYFPRGNVRGRFVTNVFPPSK
ncbi:hypothetical protein NX059_005207 [Plenodomus lindquistii]|nr:hypothetical protein NX059_005207 [Plenodomus lindquistii]